MEKLKSLIERIKWRSILAVLLLVAVIAVIFFSLPAGSETSSSGIRISASIDTSSINAGDTMTVDVELQNMNSDKGLEVYLKGLTYTELLFFDETYSQTFTTSKITIGPQERRRLAILLRSKPGILDGKYSVDLTAFEYNKEDAGAMQRVFVELEEVAE